jgi:hypothetical protein
MMALWCSFSLGSIVCGVALEAETNGGEVKSCLPDWCYAQSCLFGRCYARLIFLGGVDNSSDCSALPFEKGMTPVLSATPSITGITTVQNIVIIADSIIYYITNPDTQVLNFTKIA